MIRTHEGFVHETRKAMKGGTGEVFFEHIWKKNSDEEMHSRCRQFSRLTLNPGCSVGMHTHHGEEEIYYILSGKVRTFDHGEWVELHPGDASICRDGETHAMECTGDVPAVYLAVVIVY